MDIQYTPLKMKPVLKDYIWGGTKLKTVFGKQTSLPLVAESWELSCHPAGFSRVEAGKYQGRNICELGEIDRIGFWGTNCRQETFPILVKLIDSASPLSIQVHPSDVTARMDQGEFGKAEMWYIISCEPKSFLYLGFYREVSKEEITRRIQDGTICEVLNKVPVVPGDVFFIQPGTIHAIGAGITIAEIQQNSNTTFRVYDYARCDAQGNPRQLHIERALDVMDYHPIIPEECKDNSMVKTENFVLWEMFSCSHFKAYCIHLNGAISLCTEGISFHHLLCVDGQGIIRQDERDYPIRCGESYFIPAAVSRYQIEGACKILLSRA